MANTKNTLRYDPNEEVTYDNMVLRAGDNTGYERVNYSATNNTTNSASSGAASNAKVSAQPSQSASAAQPTQTGQTGTPLVMSQTYKDADALVQNLLANAPGKFGYTKQSTMDSVLSEYMNRPDFSYDVNADALYNQYKDQYIQQGRLAMMDTMGQAQAMSGGYGNSYAMSAGQQAYNAQLNNLNEIVPELYAQAYNRYRDETNDLYNQYGLLSADRDAEMSAYNTELNSYFNQLNAAMSREDSLYSREYGAYRDGISDSQWGAEFGASEDQRAIDNNLNERVFASNEEQRGLDNAHRDRVFESDEEQRGLDNDYRERVFTSNEEQRAFENDLAAKNYGLNEKQVNAALDASEAAANAGIAMTPDEFAKWSSILGNAEDFSQAMEIANAMEMAGVPGEVIDALFDSLWGSEIPTGDTTVNTTVTPDEEENRKVSGPHSPSSNNNRIYLVR